MAKFTLLHGIESCDVVIQPGKTVADHITDREKQFLGLPEKYNVLLDGEVIGAHDVPEEGAEYTIEAKAPDKAACAGKKECAKKAAPTAKKAAPAPAKKPAVKAKK